MQVLRKMSCAEAPAACATRLFYARLCLCQKNKLPPGLCTLFRLPRLRSETNYLQQCMCVHFEPPAQKLAGSSCYNLLDQAMVIRVCRAHEGESSSATPASQRQAGPFIPYLRHVPVACTFPGSGHLEACTQMHTVSKGIPTVLHLSKG